MSGPRWFRPSSYNNSNDNDHNDDDHSDNSKNHDEDPYNDNIPRTHRCQICKCGTLQPMKIKDNDSPTKMENDDIDDWAKTCG